MTTEIVHGAPGSYKTASLVSFYLLGALKSNRTVITNIRGFSDIDHLNKVYFYDQKKKDYSFKSTSKIVRISHDAKGFEEMARFYHWAPKGAFILMDEGQRVYPSRLTKLAAFDLEHHDDPEWPKSVEEAFDKHRHFGWDIYISTTNIAKMHKEIRQVCEFAYRHKNLSNVLPFMGKSYKRVQHDPENNGKAITNVISSTIKKIDVRAFDVYQSTTTGQAKQAKASNPFLGNFKLLLFIFVIIFFGGSALYNFVFGQGVSMDKGLHAKVDDSTLSVQSDSVQTSSVSNRDDVVRLDVSNASIKLMNSIQYQSSTIIKKNNGLMSKFIYFHSDEYGQVSSYQLSYFNIDIKPISDMFLLSYNGITHLVPSYNPKPDYYHPDNNQQKVVEVASEGAIADRAGHLNVF